MALRWPYPTGELMQAAQLFETYASLAEQLAPSLAGRPIFESLMLPMASWMAQQPRPLTLAISGGQGSGKTSLARLLQLLLETGAGLKVAAFSLDDFYLTRQERRELAQRVHPLLETRGVPGTHDTVLLSQKLEELRGLSPGERASLPRFNKAEDDRYDKDSWLEVTGPVDVILLEGWCLGAKAQPAEVLRVPVNDLEREEDADASWRNYVNEALAGSYADLFGQFQHLLFLKVPGMAQVRQWRGEQEFRLAKLGKGTLPLTNAVALSRFVMHFQRLTEWMARTQPATATMSLNEDHSLRDVTKTCQLEGFQ